MNGNISAERVRGVTLAGCDTIALNEFLGGFS